MSINIAICEDEHEQTEYVKMLVNKWADENNTEINIDMFDSAENFKASWSESKKYDILLLDIQMSGQNGVELAKELRRTDSQTVIIFITAISDYLQDGYDVSALHYIIKPIKENKFCEILDKAYRNITQAKKFLIVNSEGKNYRILFGDILYIEAVRNYVVIAAVDGEYEVRNNISKIEEELDNSFFRCQRSYIVMLKHVKYISKTEVLLDSGKIIPLRRNIYKDIYKAFINCFKGERGEE